MQETYYNKMWTYKYEYFYLNEYFSKSVKIDRIIKIALAIVSSCAIGTWATWQKLSFVCGSLIVLTEVISAINELLPYKKRIEEISGMMGQLSILSLDMERKWYDVAEGMLTEDEINDLTYNFAQRRGDIESRYFCSDSLPRNNEYRDVAQNRTAYYFRLNLGGE